MATVQTKMAREKVQKAMDARNNEPLIGAQVMWTLTGAVIKVDDLKKLYAKHGLGEEWFPTPTEGSVAFNKAINETKKQGRATGYMIRPVLESEDRIVKAIVREDAEKIKTQGKWEGDEEVQVTFDKKNESVTATKSHPVAQAIKDLYKESLDTFLVTDFIKLLTRNVHRMDAVSLRTKGGVYFVPAQHIGILTKHEAIVNELGEADFTMFRLYGDAQNMATTGRKVQRALAEELQDIGKELQKWAAEGPPREDTLKRRLDEYKALKGKAEMYSNMLAIKVDDINTGIAACAKQVMQLLGVVQTGKAEKKAEKAEAKPESKKAKVQGAAKKETRAPEAKVVRKTEAQAKRCRRSGR